MPIFTRRRYQAAVLATAALTGAAALYAASALGASPTAPASTCRASLLRITVGGQVLAEPFVANDAGAPCAADDGGLIGAFDLNPIPVSGRLLYSDTKTSNPQAESGVADISIALGALIPGAPTLGVQLLTSEAGVSCNHGNASTSSHSRVVGLTADGVDQLVIPPGDAPADVPVDPLIHVWLNEKTHSGNTVTQRALHINALAGNVDVVVAEATAGYNGNPCGTSDTGNPTSTTTTTTSTTGVCPPDGDNDDQGKGGHGDKATRTSSLHNGGASGNTTGGGGDCDNDGDGDDDGDGCQGQSQSHESAAATRTSRLSSNSTSSGEDCDGDGDNGNDGDNDCDDQGQDQSRVAHGSKATALNNGGSGGQCSEDHDSDDQGENSTGGGS